MSSCFLYCFSSLLATVKETEKLVSLAREKKLFLLEGMMNTETGKAIARKRTQYMQQFVDEFLNEWDGLDK